MLSETEKINENTKNIDLLDSFGIISLINQEDQKVAQEICKSLNTIAQAVDIISDNFLSGGRLFYFGAGTSGRLGVLDASECPPTFNTDREMVQGIIAGGDDALRNAIEGAEDSPELALADFNKLNITSKDTIVAISATGNASYVVEILKLAKEKGCKRISITSNKNAKIREYSDVFICIETGSEVICGSTRMKAGSAQKMVLNMLTTASMVKVGKVYENYMIDVKPTNTKLKERAVRIVSEIACMSESSALEVLKSNNYKIKHAILKLKYNIDETEAEHLLQQHNGILRKVFNKLD